jgi:hypothetical protein
LIGTAGFTILTGDRDYFANLARSQFCLSPTGDGWGRRTTLAAMFGCVPVIVQDAVKQPFEDQLPYHRFAIRSELARRIKSIQFNQIQVK